MTPVEDSFNEFWVRDTLRRALPEGVVAHRATEVLRSLRDAPRTFNGLQEAFWEPLRLFVNRRTTGYDEMRDALIERIEDALVEDDRVFVQDWIEQERPNWHRKSASYWKGVFKQANRESRLPDWKAIDDYQVPTSHRTWSKSWRAILARYQKWRLPPSVMCAEQQFEKPSDWVRQIRYIERGIERGNFPRFPDPDLSVRYGPTTAAMLDDHISEMTKDLTCVDNIRVASMELNYEMSHFRWQRRQGCCGSVEKRVWVLGTYYLIGCNYGH